MVHPATSATDVSHRLEDVRQRIDAAARRAGRSADAIDVVVVTKGHGPEMIRAAYAAGLRRLGENRVDELVPKVHSLADLEGVEWHVIGHLQSRKVKDLPEPVAVVHSVDRLKIASLLDEYAGRRRRRLDVLLECNVSGESQKGGWRLDDRGQWSKALPEIEQVARMPRLRVLGLMTLAPLTTDKAVVRETFRSLRELRDFLCGRLGVEWPHLSMGMSDDFEMAVEEGATLLRVGRAILGERPTAP